MHDVKSFKVLATKCGSCGCGCPTVLEGENSDELVIVGKVDDIVLKNATVAQHTGEGEIAVIIPKSLLLEAAKALRG